jgi:hypothetical protein
LASSSGGSQIWQAGGVTTGTGTVVITVLTARELAGTFSFSMVAGPNATGAKNVTNGAFDMSF